MFEKLKLELASSRRLRVGLALIVAVLWLYGALMLRDARDDRTRAFQSASAQLARVQQATKQTEWPKRLEEAKIAQVALESGLWRGDTLGLSRAALQDWLAQQLKQAQASRPLITLAAQDDAALGASNPGNDAAAAELEASLWKVKAKLTFDFTAESLDTLLGKLATPALRTTIESLRVLREPVPRVEMVVVAYFQKPQQAQGASTPDEVRR